MKETPKNLPKLKKTDLNSSKKFEEEKSETSRGAAQKIWIIVLAFVILMTLSIVIWFLFSGRSDNKLNGKNWDAIRGKDTEEVEEEEEFDVDTYEIP